MDDGHQSEIATAGIGSMESGDGYRWAGRWRTRQQDRKTAEQIVND